MAVSIFDENTPHDGTLFTPFDESRAGAIKRAARSSTINSRPGINTKAIDGFRQGVEISSQIHRLKGLGAKVWAGNIEGYTSVVTYGQALPFTEFKGTKIFEELPKFNPVAYISMGPNYPLPLVFNDGPQQNKEASLQPFTIPYRSDIVDIDGSEKPRSIRGSLEDGNQDALHLNGRTTRIEQFIPYQSSFIEQEPFLDEGQEYFGDSTDGSIIIEGYVWDKQHTIEPFIETKSNVLVEQLNTTDSEMIRVLTSIDADVNLDEDIRKYYGRSSAAAGSVVYGPNMAQYGTDSIAYVGTARGN